MAKIIKKVIFILTTSIIILTILMSTQVIAVEAGLENLTGNGQVGYGTYILDDRPVYVYGTTGGGYVDYLSGNDDYHIYQAEARSGWKFVRWVTYYEINSNSRGQNSTIGLSDAYYFSTPENDEVECNVYSPKIRINNGADILDYSDLYRLYAVFKPIVTATVGEQGEILTSYTYTQATNRVELPVSYGETSETIHIQSKEIGYIIDKITVSGSETINNVNDDLYFYQFKEVKEPKSLHATFKPITYKIDFNGNGNTSGEMNSQTFSYSTAQNLNTNAFQRKGYTFNGWNTNANGTGTSYTDKQQVNNLTTENLKTITLYAQWKPADLTGTVTITGEEMLGKILTVSVEETNNTGTLSYQWQRNGETIQGATETTYTISKEDVGKNISCKVTSSVQTNSILGTTDVISDEYAVVYDLTNITTEGYAIAKIGEEYKTTLKSEAKYKLPESVSIKIGGNELSSDKYSYDCKTGSLKIPAEEITGDIEIIASAVKLSEYKVTINQVDGATITPNGVINEILEGSNLDIKIKADEGYKITAIKVNGVEQTLPLLEDIITLEYINEDMNVVVEVEKNKDSITSNPQTGDNILLFIGLLVISIIGIIITTKFRKEAK